MATTAFVGVGNMGDPMARNRVKAGHELGAFDRAAGAARRPARSPTRWVGPTRSRPLREAMDANIGHTAGPGTGRAAKMCDNPIVGISTTAVAEAFDRDDPPGRARRKPFDVALVNAGPWRALTPAPGPDISRSTETMNAVSPRR
jgi:hypothetical protein